MECIAFGEKVFPLNKQMHVKVFSKDYLSFFCLHNYLIFIITVITFELNLKSKKVVRI
jgi:hypothetical protein